MIALLCCCSALCSDKNVCSTTQGLGLNTAGLNPAALAALQAANNPAWSGVAAQLRRAGSAGGVPGLGPLFPGGHAVAAQQVG